MKRILILGAMATHVPVIKRAKERGLYVITCDYIPENEGHGYADEAYYYSTTDFEAVESLARGKNIDGILTFCSDPAALTASVVAERLNLPGSNYTAVKIMSEKDLFRDFLRENDFNVPKYKSYSDWENLERDLDSFDFPLLLKPVDSSGSKGVVKIHTKKDLKHCYLNALSYSRSKRVIVEEYIEPLGKQIHGDAFVLDNKVKFIKLCDQYFDSSTGGIIPYSSCYPSSHIQKDIKRVEKEISRFISIVGFGQGGINVEARISKSDHKVYLIEIGPRNGGNCIPQLLQYATGYNFIDTAIDCALGLPYSEQTVNDNGFFSQLILRAKGNGILKNVVVDKKLEEKIIYRCTIRGLETNICAMDPASSTIAVLIASYQSLQEMESFVNDFQYLYNIEQDQ